MRRKLVQGGREKLSDVDVRVLGPLSISIDGTQLRLAGQRPQRLLARLLLDANRVVSRDVIIDTCWEDPPDSARQQVHNVVAGLRRDLDRGRGLEIVTEADGYRLLVTEAALDLTRFRQLVRDAVGAVDSGDLAGAIRALTSAEGLWHGPALVGLGGRYFEGIRARLAEERLAATARCLRLRIENGESGEVIGELTEQVDANPTSESLRATLMAALYHTGRRVDALEVFQIGRRLLVDELGLEPGPELSAMHALVLKGTAPTLSPAVPQTDPPRAPDREFEAADEAAPATRGRCFLPYDPRDFTGRLTELELISRVGCEPSSVSLALVAISGMGGIGKTALAVRIGYLLADDYPDGQYFIDLRGHTDDSEPLPSKAALGNLLQQAGIPQRNHPTDVEGLSQAWRAHMAGRRALVVLDNAVDIEQVRPLLPGASGPMVLVTSRRTFATLEGAVSVSLELPSVEEACALFIRIAGSHRTSGQDQEVLRAVESCGRLPLAIRIAAARLRDRTSWSISYLNELLGNETRRMQLLDTGPQGLPAAVQLSYRHLPEDRARALRLLTVHPGPDLTAESAAALADLPTATAAQILESLLDDNLLLQETAGRYRFHDLVRDCIVRLRDLHDSPEATRLARDRLLVHSVRESARLCQPLAAGLFRAEAVLAWEPDSTALTTPEAAERLNEEWGNHAAIARVACAERWSPDAWQLPCLLQPYISYSGTSGTSAEMFELGLAAARDAGSAHGEALCLYVLGGIRVGRLDLDAAQDIFAEAALVAERRGLRELETYIHTSIGVVLVKGERYNEAYKHFLKAQKEADGSALAGLHFMIENNLGIISGIMGHVDEALSRFSASRAWHRDQGDMIVAAQVELNMGMLLARNGRGAEALKHLEHALEMSGRSTTNAIGQAGLCMAYSELGLLDQAINHGLSALDLSRAHSLLEAECVALLALGDAYWRLQLLEDSESAFSKAAELARDRQTQIYEARAYEGLAHLALQRGEPATAEECFTLAVEIYPEDAGDRAQPMRHLRSPHPGGGHCARCMPGVMPQQSPQAASQEHRSDTRPCS